MAIQFAGVYPANPTPTTDDGHVNEAALRAVLEGIILHGVHGFWIAGTAGEGPIRDDAQRAIAARVAAETCKGRAKVSMHVGAMSTASAVKGAKAALTAGCDAVCCLPPRVRPDDGARGCLERSADHGHARRGCAAGPGLHHDPDVRNRGTPGLLRLGSVVPRLRPIFAGRAQ